MATKAKLTLSQFLFRRTSSSSNSSSSNNQNSSSINHYQSQSSCSNNNNVNTNNANITKTNNLEVGKYEQFADFQEQLQLVNKVYPPKKVQANFATVSAASGRHGLYEIQNQQENLHKKHSSSEASSPQQQLHGILKRGCKNDGNNGQFRSAALGGKTTRSSLTRSRSNPNPNNNPLKEVSWSCPTLEKRREVILNYFERIILENKQEQNGMQNKPNIPCEGEVRDGGGRSPPSGGEPIYEEISDCTSYAHPNSSDRTGSLKPKMPKKVRMNIPQNQEQKIDSGNSPIYDKVLSRSHSMIEPASSSSYYTGGNGGYYDILPSNTSSTSETHSFYENFTPYSSASSSSSSGSDYVMDGGNGRNKNVTTTRIAGRSQSFHDNYRSTSNTGSYNIQCSSSFDMDQMYAKVCKRKKMKGENNEDEQLSYIDHRQDDKGNFSVQVSCGNVVTIPVMMPCSSSFSTSCLSLSSSSDNNNDDVSATIRRNNDQDNDSNNGLTHYYSSEKILPDKDIAYVNNTACVMDSSSNLKRNRNNLSVIHLLASYDPATEIEEFIPTTPAPSYTAIIDSTESAPKSISVPVRAVGFKNSNPNNNNYVSGGEVVGREDDDEEDASHYLYPPTIASVHRRQQQEQEHLKPLMVTNCSYGYDVEDYEEDKDRGKLSSTSCSSASSCTDGEVDDDDEEDDHEEEDDETKYKFPDGIGSVTLLKKITFQDDPKELILLTSDSEDEDICEHKSLIDMTTTRDIMDDSGLDNANEKYLAMMDDEEREFDSFLDDNDGGSSSPEGKGERPFSADNLREQRTFAQSQQNVPQEALKKKAASVLDLINSEISDLHMRELELKKLHTSPIPPSSEKSDKLIKNQINDGDEFYGEEGSSGEDDFSDSAIEYDGFTTNGSHSSGQVSPSDNLNEMTSHHPQDETEQIQTTTVDANPEEKQSPVNQDNNVDDREDEPKGNEERHKVRPLAEEEDRTVKFSATDETPIEREIRLIREREDEFKRLNTLKTSSNTRTASPSSAAAAKTASLPPLMKSKPVLNRPSKADLPSLPQSVTASGPKDAQYELATARFKKEIEESMQREKELMVESRLKKGATAGGGDNINDEASNPDEVKAIVEEAPEPPAQNETSPAPKEQEEQQQAAPIGPENVLRKPTLVKLPINKLPAARFFSPPAYNGNKPNRITPVVSPIRGGSLGFPSSRGNSSVGGSLNIGISKPSFTSMEKFMSQYMSQAKAAAPPTITDEQPKVVAEVPAPTKQSQPQQLPITEDPLRIVQKPGDEKDEEEVEEEKETDEKPKRRYVPAQDKIHKEIQELVMREKELTKARSKWKSTLDLPEAMKDADNEGETTKSTISLVRSRSISKDSISPTAAAVANDADNEKVKDGKGSSGTHTGKELDFKRVAEDVREVTRVKAPARRRHSVLINQWEERIRQQQQVNNKK